MTAGASLKASATANVAPLRYWIKLEFTSLPARAQAAISPGRISASVSDARGAHICRRPRGHLRHPERIRAERDGWRRPGGIRRPRDRCWGHERSRGACRVGRPGRGGMPGMDRRRMGRRRPRRLPDSRAPRPGSAVDANHGAIALVALGELGYVIETDWRPVRVEVVAAGRGRVDVHPVTFDEAGDGRQPTSTAASSATRRDASPSAPSRAGESTARRSSNSCDPTAATSLATSTTPIWLYCMAMAMAMAWPQPPTA